MPVKVYIWEMRDKEAIGHTSMSLSDGTHISWWPATPIDKTLRNVVKGTNISAPARRNQTLADDIQFEGCEPEHTFTLHDLDEAAISKWWTDFQKKNTIWDLKIMNCSTVVYKALCAGKPALKFFSGIPIWFPAFIRILVKGMTPGRGLRQEDLMAMNAMIQNEGMPM